MKKFLLSLLMLIISLFAMAQDSLSIQRQYLSRADSLTLRYLHQLSRQTAPGYKLYPTQNVWTFIELETFTGRMWQVQFSTQGEDYRFKTPLNFTTLIPEDDPVGEFVGRFELYETQNIYNFILLDVASGRTWQVQWSKEYRNRLVEGIEVTF